MRLLTDSDIMQMYTEAMGSGGYEQEVPLTEEAGLYLESWINAELESGRLVLCKEGRLHATEEYYGTIEREGYVFSVGPTSGRDSESGTERGIPENDNQD